MKHSVRLRPIYKDGWRSHWETVSNLHGYSDRAFEYLLNKWADGSYEKIVAKTDHRDKTVTIKADLELWEEAEVESALKQK